MAHDFKTYPELTNNQMKFYYFESPHKQITEDFEAKVTKVTDGDTIRVTCDFRDFDFPIRLLNIDAPETSEGDNIREGLESKEWLSDLILNKEVTILIDEKNRVEKWGRLLGEVLFMGMNVNELSLFLGFSTKFEDGQNDEQFETIKETGLY